MSESEHIASLITLAMEDLRAARTLASPLPRQAAYFLQQAAEKAGKALLASTGVDPERIHRIGRLAEALPADHPLRQPLMALDPLSPYRIAMRYPEPSGRLPRPPSPERLQRDIDAVADFLARSRQHLGLHPSAGGG